MRFAAIVLAFFALFAALALAAPVEKRNCGRECDKRELIERVAAPAPEPFVVPVEEKRTVIDLVDRSPEPIAAPEPAPLPVEDAKRNCGRECDKRRL